ncbi:conserved hypothetical protein [Candidatus Magnetomoraceae bacterium gMMP-15]
MKQATETMTIKISKEELKNVIQAYQILQVFLQKFISKNELYHLEFIQGLEESLSDVEAWNVKKVDSFKDFIQ